jgi:lipoyl(octanoyl) transferase
MRLHVLPTRQGGAAENMATDFMLLQRYPEETAIRFRHYGWHRPAFTFGYSQKFAFVRSQLPVDLACEVCRRPTGGGVVDHRNDWTYSLVIPRGHPAYDARATASYRLVHSCIARSLEELGQPAAVKETCDPAPDGEVCAPGVCFTRAELFDVIEPGTSRKIAGAAQKRTKHGLLFQGSIDCASVTSRLHWEAFEFGFTRALAQELDAECEECGWPSWSDDEMDGLVAQYSSSEWNEYR